MLKVAFFWAVIFIALYLTGRDRLSPYAKYSFPAAYIMQMLFFYCIDVYVGGGVWEFVGDVLEVLFIFYLFAVVCNHLLFLFILTISRKRPIRVFISYNHLDESLAEEINQTLKSQNFETVFLPFIPRSRDEINWCVTEGIREVDALIAIPSRAEIAYANYEISQGQARSIPVIYLIDTEGRYLPDPALPGYPVFILEKLYEKNMLPLRDFLNFLFFHKADSYNTAKRVLHKASNISGYVGCAIMMLCAFTISPLANKFILKGELLFFLKTSATIAFMFMVVIMFYVLHKWTVSRKWAQHAVCKIVAKHELTFDVLRRVLTSIERDRDILACLLPGPLKARRSGHKTADNGSS